MTCSTGIYANTDALQEADFDPSFIIGNHKNIDVSRFKYSNPILPGEYNLDLYINNIWFGKRKMRFQTQSNQNNNVTTCFDQSILLNYGVKKEALSSQIDELQRNNPCLSLDQLIKEAYYELDTSQLRMDIFIPQSAMQKNAQGYVDPSVWDSGINAGFISYSATAYQSKNNFSTQRNQTNAFMSLNTGFNIGRWQLRHNAQMQWNNSNGQTKPFSYTTTNTYLQSAIPQYHSVITIGDHFTNGDVFDSFGYRGIDLSSDDRMLPNSMQGYAPQIRGNAKTSAKVEVRQQGQMIYQINVSPGPFEINDLYPTGFGGSIEVTVIEADGQIQRFTVPYASVVQMLRPGLNKYSITLGRLRDYDLKNSPYLAQGKYQQGINNYLTGYSGFQIANRYTALILGSAFATPIGAISLDMTYANATQNKKTLKGQSYKLSYSKLIIPTNTNLTLAAYRYSTENYYTLRDNSLINELENKAVSASGVGKQRSQFQITLNQNLPKKMGNLYLLGSWSDYWNRSQHSKQYQFGYSNNYKSLTYSFSALHRLINTAGSTAKSDTEYLFSINFPLSIRKTEANVNITGSKDNLNIGASGIINDRLNYGIGLSQQNNINAYNINSSYKTDIATLSASYNYAPSYQQTTLSTRGNIILHKNGILFGPDQGQTMAIIYAPNAVGAKVNNGSGLYINKSGYAIVPYLMPYRLNDISLDPQDMSNDVELEETSQRVTPYAGAISKLDFATKTGYAIYISSKTSQQTNLPLAAEIYNSKNEVIGFVGQGSLAYIRSYLEKDRITIKWGDDASQSCHIEYDLTNQLKNDNQTSMLMTEATCK